MPRYIDADKVMEEINRIGGHNLCEWDTLGVKALIYRQDTADVVEVVRCEDCKYCEHCYPVKAIGGEAVEGWYCKIRKRRMRSDDFCSYGEQKEDK